MTKTKIIALCMLLLLTLSGCAENIPNQKIETGTTEDTTLKLENEIGNDELKKINGKCIELTKLYKNVYIAAEKIPSEYFKDQTVISQSSIDNIEKCLIKAGYSVINSDVKYPSFLENPKGFYDFWQSVKDGKNAEQEIISVSNSGGLCYYLLQYSDNKKYCTFVNVEWDDKNNASISSATKNDVLNWDLTDNDNFYYQSHPSDMHYDDYTLIRLKQVDKKLYDLNAKYIIPIGYQSNNLFLCDWDSNDYGDLCFNDLLEFLYKAQNDDYFYADKYETVFEPYFHTCIPAAIFEKAILPYFELFLQDFRKRTLL